MHVCFPVENNEGLSSTVYGHFGSAPAFLLVDARSREVTEVINRDLHHAHGQCSPLKALGGKTVDAVVVGGIGGGALNGLTRAGIRVFRAEPGSVAENLDKLASGQLAAFSLDHVCGGHGHGQGCGHSHEH
jgi:predicted Fe-Mo cluster-binding NifX family protein